MLSALLCYQGSPRGLHNLWAARIACVPVKLAPKLLAIGTHLQVAESNLVREEATVPGYWPGIYGCEYKNLSTIYLHTAIARLATLEGNMSAAEVCILLVYLCLCCCHEVACGSILVARAALSSERRVTIGPFQLCTQLCQI